MQFQIKKILAILLCFLLCFEQSGLAQVAGQLDISGHLSGLRNAFAPDVFRPLHLRYLFYNPQENNFRLFLDKGSLKNPKPQEVQDTTKELLNYFFIGISLPNDKFWVNLRPDAEDNIIDPALDQTDIGRIMLESDLQLKKDTARFTSPETPEGKKYWDKLYQKAGEIFSSENITIPTLTRPWIVPGEIIIRETQDSAYIYKATLKVMLEQDYLRDSPFRGQSLYSFKDERLKELNEYSSQLIRELIIPKLNKEINSAKRYASLRQVYYSLIMAQWFKARHKGLSHQVMLGTQGTVPWSKTTYFKEYQKSFKEGEYNIKEPVYTPYGQTIRTYFSGGMNLNPGPMPAIGETSSTISSIPTNNPGEFLIKRGESGVVITVQNETDLEMKVAAIEEAHQIGESSPYTLPEIAQKARILKEAGLGKDERRRLMEEGIAGTGKSPVEKISRQFISSLLALESKLNDSDWDVRQAAANALGPPYQALIKEGKEVSLSQLESKLNDSDWDVRQAAANALGPLYQALIKEGKMSLPQLESKLNDSNWAMRQAADNALGPLYQALIKEGKILDEDYAKYRLWRESNLLYQETLIKQYLVASNAQEFISSLKRQAENAINNGFNYNNEEELWLAYLGLRISGINISYDEFKERMNKVSQFDRKHPGYFGKIFAKIGRPRIIELSSQGARSVDTSGVDMEVFMLNLAELLKVRQRIDSFNWMDEDFPESKVFNLRNLYYLFKRQEAQERGIIKEGEHFRFEFPQEEAMKQEFLSKRKGFYKIVFSLAKDRLGDGLIGAKCLVLIRDLIISDIMLDEGLLNEMRSPDPERTITAFKNFYEDYKNHLPNSLGLNVGKIKGLEKCFEDFSSEVYIEISKLKTVKRTTALEPYRLVGQGFLSIFRGRAGIIDCSFDMDYGIPFTRAMHEDTRYLFVYKGKELKGYIGLMIAQGPDKNKVLTVDTINSPSLDGEELLGNLFKALNDLAGELGCIGIALPEDIGPSFNFNNEDTIPQMTVYKKARPISAVPWHQKSWDHFTDMFGEDRYNSIEKGRFVLLDLGSSSSPAKDDNNHENPRSTTNQMGGIDFRALPIVTQAMSNLRDSPATSHQAVVGQSLQTVNLTSEWRQIENMLNAGIIPSAERLKEYLQVSLAKDRTGDIQKVISFISDILRIEEERCATTEAMLKDILVVLESANSNQALKEIFLGKI